MQAEKLSSIGLMAAGIAHEVNTPLAVISSNAQMLMRQMEPDDPRTKTLDKIIAQAFRASEIANSLLKFSRVGGSEGARTTLCRHDQQDHQREPVAGRSHASNRAHQRADTAQALAALGL